MSLRPARAFCFRGVLVTRIFVVGVILVGLNRVISKLCVGCVFLVRVLYAQIELFVRGNAYVGMSFIITVLVIVACNSNFRSHRGWVR